MPDDLTNSPAGPRFTKTVAGLPSSVPFVGPETQERAARRSFAARLGANKSGFGPAPSVIAAMTQAASEAWKYGDPEGYELRAAIADLHETEIENVVLGEGIDGLLGTLCRLLVAPGDPVVTSSGAYPTFAYHVQAQGGALTLVSYRGDMEDPDGLAAAARRMQAKMVYMANPDNPMGTVHPAERVLAFRDALPPDCLLVLDEAYVDMAPSGTAPPFDEDDLRMIRLRTFSKAYGLAGLRIGYAIGAAETIAVFNRVRNHFGVGRLSQVAALAALRDPEYLAAVVEQIAASRRTIGRIAEDNGLVPLPSAANFVAIDCGGDGALSRRLVRELGRRGVFVRMPFVRPQDRCIRVSAGPPEDMETFAAALPEALKAARG